MQIILIQYRFRYTYYSLLFFFFFSFLFSSSIRIRLHLHHITTYIQANMRISVQRLDWCAHPLVHSNHTQCTLYKQKQ